jgi:hypothetical protein
MTTSLESSMATFHFAAVASATGFLINKLDVSNNNSSDKKNSRIGIVLLAWVGLEGLHRTSKFSKICS